MTIASSWTAFVLLVSLLFGATRLAAESPASRLAHARAATAYRLEHLNRPAAHAPMPPAALMRWDISLFRAINERGDNRVSDVLMPAVTNLGLGGWQAAFLLSLLAWAALAKRPDWRATALMGVVGLVLGLLAPILKQLIPRDRPPLMLPNEVVLLVHPNYHGSFPSGHTLTSFTIASIIARRHPWTAPWAYGLASLIGLSRISVGVHWPTDVLASAVLGICCGWLVTLRWGSRKPAATGLAAPAPA